MNNRLIVLTNCSERKRDGGNSQHLSAYKGSLGQKARRWCNLLARPSSDRIPAIERYQGDHWTASLRLLRKAEKAGWETDLWVASAGYGLIPAHAPILPYAATFAGNHPDSVAAGTSYFPKEASRQWWSYLSEWEGPMAGSPRTLEDLAAQYPEAAWLVLMSPTYLEALTEDLLAARGEMTHPDRLLVVSGAPGPSDPKLVPHWVPSLEICRGVLGGSCSSLNARVAGHVASSYSPDQWTSEVIQPQMNLWMAGLDPIERPARKAISDADALAFIRKRTRQLGRTSHTALLRELRDQGIACEQKRFKALFQSLEVSA